RPIASSSPGTSARPSTVLPPPPSRSRFFFSSRRRHTSWPRDWSSDVCSSDLRSRSPSRHHIHTVVRTPNGNDYGRDLLRQHHARSEERRVGKECRLRRSAYGERDDWDDLDGAHISG